MPHGVSAQEAGDGIAAAVVHCGRIGEASTAVTEPGRGRCTRGGDRVRAAAVVPCGTCAGGASSVGTEGQAGRANTAARPRGDSDTGVVTSPTWAGRSAGRGMWGADFARGRRFRSRAGGGPRAPLPTLDRRPATDSVRKSRRSVRSRAGGRVGGPIPDRPGQDTGAQAGRNARWRVMTTEVECFVVDTR